MKITLSAVLICFSVTGVHASTTWDGVYSDAQAQRGRQQYLQHCSVCHSASLQGNNESPPLVGQFMPDWRGSPLSDLYDFIGTTMPLDRPGSLNASAYADIVAYLLQANGFPGGQKELLPADLRAIQFEIIEPEFHPSKGHR